MSLTGVNTKLIAESWGWVEQDLLGTGIALFQNFLCDYPANRKYFKLIKGDTREEMAKCTQLHRHAKRVMTSVGQLLAISGDSAELQNQLVELGKSHKPRNISSTAYDDLNVSFLKTLKDATGEKFTPEHQESWKNLLTAIFKVMVDSSRNDS